MANRTLPGRGPVLIGVMAAILVETPAIHGNVLGPCPGKGDCYEANGTPGCDDEACCAMVCAADPFCCDVEWDSLCAGEALDLCFVPPNDDCANAIPITDGDFPFDTNGATTDGPELPPECDQGFGIPPCNQDIWFEYTPTCSGTLTVSTCSQATFDTVLAAYTGCGGGFLACNDDAGCLGFTSILEVPVSCGAPVLLRVGGFGTGEGPGTLSVSCDGGSPCDTPTATCCYGSTCTEDTEEDCAAGGGLWLGPSIDCAGAPCFTLNATCLPTGKGDASVASCVSIPDICFPNEELVAGAVRIGGVYQAARWTSEGGGPFMLEVLPDLGQGSAALMVGVETGCIVQDLGRTGGVVYDPKQTPLPAWWESDVPGGLPLLDVLPTLTGGAGEVSAGTYDALEDRTMLAGWSLDGEDVQRAALWERAGKGPWSVASLPDLGQGGNGFVNQALGGIGPGGALLVGGSVLDTMGDPQPAVWTRATPMDPLTLGELPTLPGGQGEVRGSSGVDTLESAELTGWSLDGGGAERAVKWTYDGLDWSIQTLPDPENALGSRGLSFVFLFPWSLTAGSADFSVGGEQALLWLDDVPLVLTDLVPPDATQTLTLRRAWSVAGVTLAQMLIAVEAATPGDVPKAVVLSTTPIPPSPPVEPESLSEGEGDASVPYSVSDSGSARVVSGEVRIDGVYQAAVWISEDGGPFTLTPLPDLGQGSTGFVNQVLAGPGQTVVRVGGVVFDIAQSPLPAWWEPDVPGGMPLLDLLPTLAGGKGAVRGASYDAMTDLMVLTGWSRDGGGVARAALWVRPGAGAWSVAALPDLGQGAMAFTGIWWEDDTSPGSGGAGLLVGGSVLDEMGDPAPAVWTRAMPADPLVLTELPMLPGGRGEVRTSFGVDTLGSVLLAGFSYDGQGRQRAVTWSYEGNAWSIQTLGEPEGADSSRASSMAGAMGPGGLDLYIGGSADDAVDGDGATLWTGTDGTFNVYDERDLLINQGLVLRGLPAVDVAPDGTPLFAALAEPIGAGPLAEPHAIVLDVTPPAKPCPADVDGDGTVSVTDLVEVILAWGGSGGPADVNDDGTVDVQDLVAVVLAWGPCP